MTVSWEGQTSDLKGAEPYEGARQFAYLSI